MEGVSMNWDAYCCAIVGGGEVDQPCMRSMAKAGGSACAMLWPSLWAWTSSSPVETISEQHGVSRAGLSVFSSLESGWACWRSGMMAGDDAPVGAESSTHPG
eukprot:352473-Chlamydomonas_euryale.AAC.12